MNAIIAKNRYKKVRKAKQRWANYHNNIKNGSSTDTALLLLAPLHVFFYIRNMRLRLQVLLTANSGNIKENKKLSRN